MPVLGSIPIEPLYRLMGDSYRATSKHATAKVYLDGTPSAQEKLIFYNLFKIKFQRIYLCIGQPMPSSKSLDPAEMGIVQRRVKKAVEDEIQVCLGVQGSDPGRYEVNLRWSKLWESVGFVRQHSVPGPVPGPVVVPSSRTESESESESEKNKKMQ
jgi:hypothetical protein